MNNCQLDSFKSMCPPSSGHLPLNLSPGGSCILTPRERSRGISSLEEVVLTEKGLCLPAIAASRMSSACIVGRASEESPSSNINYSFLPTAFVYMYTQLVPYKIDIESLSYNSRN